MLRDYGHRTRLTLCSAVVDAQNALTQTVLAQCNTRDEFKELMTRLYDYERYGCPYKCVWARSCPFAAQWNRDER